MAKKKAAPAIVDKAPTTCKQCVGRGVIRVPQNPRLTNDELRPAPTGQGFAPGFTWVACRACKEAGKR